MTAHIAELREIHLPLVAPFQTSFGVQTSRRILLVRATVDGVEGWGECVAPDDPTYSAEYVDGARAVIRRAICCLGSAASSERPTWPARWRTSRATRWRRRRSRWRSSTPSCAPPGRRSPPASASPVTASRAASASGSTSRSPRSERAVAGYLEDGYVRIKLKIEPGWDLEPVAAIRRLVGPDVPLQVDANTAYTRDDIEHLCRLDEFDLLLIEQPLPEDDLLGHAALARAATTPICLDESLVSLDVGVRRHRARRL